MYLLVEAELHFVLAVHTQQKPTDLYMIVFNFNEFCALCIFNVTFLVTWSIVTR